MRRRPKIIDDLDRAALEFIGAVLAASGIPAPIRRAHLNLLKRLDRGYTDTDLPAELEEDLEDEIEEDLEDREDPIFADDDDEC